MKEIPGKDLPREIEALEVVSAYNHPPQWAVDIVNARIERITREIKATWKVSEPKHIIYEPRIYQIHQSRSEVKIRII